MDAVYRDHADSLGQGLLALSKLTNGPTYLIKGVGTKVAAGAAAKVVRVEEFAGKHPFGTVGLHIHGLPCSQD